MPWTTSWSWLTGELSRSVLSRMFSARFCEHQPPSRLSQLGREECDGRQGDTGTAFDPAVYDRGHGYGWICDFRDRWMGCNFRTIGGGHRPRRGRRGFKRKESTTSDRRRGWRAARKGGRPGKGRRYTGPSRRDADPCECHDHHKELRRAIGTTVPSGDRTRQWGSNSFSQDSA